MPLLSYTRPVGEAISLKCDDRLPPDYPGYSSEYFASGTMALQRALEEIKLCTNTRKPEVMLPAYACPDLISACEGAGVKAVLLDLEENTPFPSIQEIHNAQSDQTIAVIIFNFLGIAPPDELVKEIKNKGLIYVEDRAQAFLPSEEAPSLKGDYVVFSFGKGKPVSLLGGGLLLKPKVSANTTNPVLSMKTGLMQKLTFMLKVSLYNIIIRKPLYGLLLKLPGLNIGNTSYKPPQEITGLDSYRLSLLSTNINTQYTIDRSDTFVQLTELTTPTNVISLAPESPLKLLRFPLLVKDSINRDKLIEALNKQGIGATTMYGKMLPEIEFIPIESDQKEKPYSNAKQFATRLITLPCHTGVTSKDIAIIRNTLIHALKTN